MKKKSNDKISIKILCLEDSSRDMEIIAELLRDAGIELTIDWAATEKKFVSFLRNNKYDIILSDFRLPAFDAFGALRITLQICPDVPFICVSGSIGEETAIDLIRQGAVDYVLKDRLVKLPTAIKRALDEVKEKESRRQAEEALCKSEERYRLLFNTSMDGVLLTSPTGEIFSANPAACKMFQRTEEELCALGRDCVVDKSDPRLEIGLEERARTGKFSGELILMRKDGSKFPAEITTAIFKDKDKQERSSMIIRDITDRKRSEAVLRDDEAKTRTILEAISTGILIIDPETHTIVDVNAVAIKLIGESKQKIVGSVCHEYICSAEKGKCPVTDIGQSIDNSERVLITKKGKKIPILKSVAQITIGGKKFLIENFTDITERKQAEEALHESERKIREAQEMAHLGYWSWNVKTGDVEWSEEVYKIFRLDPSNFTPHIDSILALSPWPGDHERDEELIRRAMENHEMGFYEQRFLRPDKSIGYYQSTFQGKYDNQGNLTFIIGTIQDITERKQAEEKIREKDIQFRKLSANVSDLIFQFTRRPDGTYCVPIASEGIKNIFGCSPEDVLDDFAPISRVIFPEDSARVISDIEYSAKHLTFFTCEFRVQIPGKAIQWIYSKSNPEKLPDGSITWYGFNADITERKAAESKLKESEEQYRTLVETMRDGVMQVDNNDIILFVNDSLCKTLGYKREELVGKVGYEVFIHEDDKKKVIQKNKFRTKGKSDNYEVRAIKKSGEIIWLNIGGAPVYNHQGSVIGSVGILTDITERKQTEEALRKSEERYRLISAVASDYTFSTKLGAKGELVLDWVAGAFERITGYGFEEYVARGGWRAALHPDDLVKDDLDMEKLSKNQPVITELRTITKNGDTVWVRIYAHPVWDTKQEKLVGIFGAVQDITERKRAENILRESEERYHSLFDRMMDGVYRSTHEGKFVDVNPAMVKMFGFKSKEDMLKVDIKKDLYFAPSERDSLFMDTGQERTEIFRMRHKDGSEIWVEDHGTYVHDEKGNVIFHEGILRDVTARLLTEEALDKERILLRTIIDALPDRIYVKDTHGKFILNNSAHMEALGVKSQEDTIGKTDYNFRPKEYADRYAVSDQQVLQTGNPMIGKEERSISAAHGTGWMLINKVPLRNSQGNIVGLVGNSSDITALKLAEENIRMLSRAMEQSPASIVITDLEGKIEYVNPKFTQLTGYTLAEALGQNPHILKSGEKPPGEYKEMWEIIKSGKEWRGEFHNKKKSGELYWESASISPITDTSGKATHYLAVKEDITEKKSLEAQLLRSQRIESIGTLAGGVAHDLNNVLAPILLSIDVLKRSMPDKKNQRMLETLETSALRGSAIVKQILGFARGVQGEHVLIQFRHIINEITNIIRETFPKSIIIKEDMPKNIWTIVGDPTNLHQLLLNLCVNARDAMPTGGTIYIRAENKVIDEHYTQMNREAIPGQYVLMSVEDSGCGMPPAIVDRIFEPFFTTKEVGKGTGLGLSTVHAIVKSHSGFINVYSEVGKGTTFRIYLPAAKEIGDVKEELKKSLNRFMGKGELILIVDDEFSIQQITKNTLEAYGYRTLTASDGTEAIAQFASKKDEIALVLTDMIMPIMDGQKTIQVLRKMNPALKIIASSGLASKDDIIVDKGLAVDAFLVKPYNAEKLLETIHSVLKKK
ncbi:MAG: PAS domain S-box protein [Ignavibacteriales bacterium]|nr:PAS domain S-box protein [Ignavibacteriales bacterium]